MNGEFRINIEDRFNENQIVENKIPGHATWLLQVWDILFAAFKGQYEDNVAEAIGLSKDLRKRTDESHKVTFEVVCEQLAKTWERFPNEWIMAAFTHRKLLTWEEGAAALGSPVEELKKTDGALKDAVKLAVKNRVAVADKRMIAEIWPERAWGRKRARLAAAA